MSLETKLKRQAVSIFQASLKAADPREAVFRHLRIHNDSLIADKAVYRLNHFQNIYVVGAGKASASMAQAIEHLLGRRIVRGLINTKYGHRAPLRRIELNECGHPEPDRQGMRGAQRIAELVSEAGPNDLVICLISGGASALLPLPAPPITLSEKKIVTKLLLGSGANIHETNAVRKHLSRIKGGQLARMASPATVLSLLLSDVIGDDLDVIGSGPTAPDASTFQAAAGVLAKYGLGRRVPPSVGDRIRQGIGGAIAETPKPGDPLFARTRNLVVGSNRLAVEAAAKHARDLGFRTLVLSTRVQGETADIARMHGAIAREIVEDRRPLRAPACIITGGETTVSVRGKGLGGRNQEFALAAAMDIAGLPNVVVLSGGTDGTDGPTEAAGAIATGSTIERAQKKKLAARRFLANNDSYHFFKALNDLLITGPTNTNVMDIHLVLVA